MKNIAKKKPNPGSFPPNTKQIHPLNATKNFLIN